MHVYFSVQLDIRCTLARVSHNTYYMRKSRKNIHFYILTNDHTQKLAIPTSRVFLFAFLTLNFILS